MTPDLAVAIDLGGTRMKAGVVEVGTGTVVAPREAEPSRSSWPDVRLQMETAARAMREAHPGALGFGLAMPGVIDRGQITSLPGKLPGAEGFDLGGWARSLARDGPAVVINDAMAAAVGEAMVGAGAAHHRVVVLTLGTGVGVGVVEHGRPLGAGPLGGGILGGQVPVGGDDDLADTAGARGTIESRCRAAALLERAGRLGGAWPSAAAVLAAAETGDDIALAAVDQHRDDLARAVVALAFAHAPDAVVVAGGMATGPLLLDGLADLVGRRLTFGLEVAVVPAALGDGAALAGLGILLGMHRA